jgi:hypothetical protein
MPKSKSPTQAATALEIPNLDGGPLSIGDLQVASLQGVISTVSGDPPLARANYFDPPFKGYVAAHRSREKHDYLVIETLSCKLGGEKTAKTHRLLLSPSACSAAIHLASVVTATIERTKDDELRKMPDIPGRGRKLLYCELGYNGGFLECRLSVFTTRSSNAGMKPFFKLQVINNPIGHAKTCTTYTNEQIPAFLEIVRYLSESDAAKALSK